MAVPVRSYHRNALRILLALSLGTTAMLGGAAQAQRAEGTAVQLIRVKAYGMFTYLAPNYASPSRNKGGTVGADIDGFRLLPHTELGFDIRYTFTGGPVTNQYVYGGGPRFTASVGPFRPYVDFLIGQGKGVFKQSTNPDYTQDNSTVYTYGGGLEYQINRTWAIRGDAQRERWRFSVRQPFFYPTGASIGVSYQLHLHSRTGPNW